MLLFTGKLFHPSKMKRLLFLVLMAWAILPAHSAQAQFLDAFIPKEKSATKEGFVLPAKGDVKILVFRPDVYVAEQTTAGLDQPNADWTNAARSLLADALKQAQTEQGNILKQMPPLSDTQAALMNEYSLLFKVIADSAVTHRLFPGDRLPTKKGKSDWTLGTGAAQLGANGGGDYGLFIYTYDSYGSSGRKTAQVVAALMGVGVSSGVHIGYAGLVDLKTGDLVWMNADISMGGDIRTSEGAAKRVQQLLEDFPARGVVPKVTVEE